METLVSVGMRPFRKGGCELPNQVNTRARERHKKPAAKKKLYVHVVQLSTAGQPPFTNPTSGPAKQCSSHRVHVVWTHKAIQKPQISLDHRSRMALPVTIYHQLKPSKEETDGWIFCTHGVHSKEGSRSFSLCMEINPEIRNLVVQDKHHAPLKIKHELDKSRPDASDQAITKH